MTAEENDEYIQGLSPFVTGDQTGAVDEPCSLFYSTNILYSFKEEGPALGRNIYKLFQFHLQIFKFCFQISRDLHRS
jgi:hypothetical protein